MSISLKAQLNIKCIEPPFDVSNGGSLCFVVQHILRLLQKNFSALKNFTRLNCFIYGERWCKKTPLCAMHNGECYSNQSRKSSLAFVRPKSLASFLSSSSVIVCRMGRGAIFM